MTDVESAKKLTYGSTDNTPTVSIHGADDEEVAGRRKIGTVSAIFIVFNRMIGTGVFATPSTILALSGSVGMSLIMWVIGAIIAGAGMWVYVIWGTAIPRNGGEKNYLEYLMRKPKFLATCMYAANGVLLGWASGNSIVFGEYILRAANQDSPGQWTRRVLAFGCITFCFLLHGTNVRAGLYLQNVLGVLKIGILAVIIITGFIALGGHLQVDKPHNFVNAFEGTTASASAFCNSLFSVIWAFVGYSNANYALSETSNPKRTLKIAGPSAIFLVTILYILCNIAYFAAATKEEITSSGTLVAALLFRNVYGSNAERALSVFVALSALGNVLSVVFSQGRVNQELGREGILPFSKFWGSNRPFNAPLAGLGLHWAICLITIFALPPGDAYNFVINTISYPLAIINATIAFGIVGLQFRPYSDWVKPGKAGVCAAFFFGAANVFLFIVPFIPPPVGAEPYQTMPYWTHAVAGWAVFGIGFIYWLLWAKVLPRVGGYELVRNKEIGKDGLERNVFHYEKNK